MLAICLEFGQGGGNTFPCGSCWPHAVSRGTRHSEGPGREDVACPLQLGSGQGLGSGRDSTASSTSDSTEGVLKAASPSVDSLCETEMQRSVPKVC